MSSMIDEKRVPARDPNPGNRFQFAMTRFSSGISHRMP
jgi:hypothetical protein